MAQFRASRGILRRVRASTPAPRRPPRRACAALLSLWTCSCGQPAPAAPTPAIAPAPVQAPPPSPPPAASDALPAPPPPAKVRGVKQLAEATSPFSTIRVRQEGTRRSLVFVRERGDDFVQTILDLADPDTPTLAYAWAMTVPLAAIPAPRRLLMIGLGGGTLVRLFLARVPAAELDVVEIDPEVVRLAAEWFGVVPGPRLRVHTDDGVRFIAASRDTYDIIWLDAFLDPGRADTDIAGVPEELRGRALLEAVRARLAPDGLAAFNIHHIFGYHEHIDAIAAVFPRVYLVSPPDANERTVLAFNRDAPLSLPAVRERAAALDPDGRVVKLVDTITPWTPRGTQPGAE